MFFHLQDIEKLMMGQDSQPMQLREVTAVKKYPSVFCQVKYSVHSVENIPPYHFCEFQ